MHMKKIIIIILVILLIGLGLFFFLGNGKEKISNFFSEGSDFGTFFDVEPQSKNDFVETPITTETPQIPESSTYEAPVLRQISFEPISGYTTFSITSTSTETYLNSEGLQLTRDYLATSTAVRFQERATGHVYDVFEFALAPLKVTKETIQKVYSSIFSNNINIFLSETLTSNNEQVKTTFNIIRHSTSTGDVLAQSDISTAVTNFVYNKFSNKLVYSLKQNGVSNIYTSNIDKTSEKIVKTLYFNDFLLDPINATDVVITTKPSKNNVGYSYILNTATGSFTKILGDIPGLLVKVSPDEKHYLYLTAEQTRPTTRIYDEVNKTTNLITINTIPEKCVFSDTNSDDLYCFGAPTYKPGEYPDDWYKGKIFNSEFLYKINLTNNYVQQLYSFEDSKLTFDVLNPQISVKDGFILFENKYDLTLWSLNLERLKGEVF